MASLRRDYCSDKRLFQTFFQTHKSENKLRYLEDLKNIASHEKFTLEICLQDIQNFDYSLAEAVAQNVITYEKLVSDVVLDLLPNFEQGLHIKPTRLQGYVQMKKNTHTFIPNELLKTYDVVFFCRSVDDILSLRSLGSSEIGKLRQIHGVVGRCDQVNPKIKVATFTCETCSAEAFLVVNKPSFTYLKTCPNCEKNGMHTNMYFESGASKFESFQEIVIHEESVERPPGSTSVSLRVFCFGEMVQRCGTGDHVIVTGVLLPQTVDHFKQIETGLSFNVFFKAYAFKKLTERGGHCLCSKKCGFLMCEKNELTIDTSDQEMALFEKEDAYELLSKSIAPEICGYDDLKKIILLMLVGGVRIENDDIKIRGEIHVCIVGDPGVGKSQLLTFLRNMDGRVQLATGRGSSAAGLSAAVLKNKHTHEYELEPGSLVLANKSICCIDEFDKMSDSDRDTLYEAMESQTISITKAGVARKLPACVSVLAAANPIYGVYNLGKSVEKNVGLSAALFSRFDSIWLMRDIRNPEQDMAIARHVSYVHMHSTPPTLCNSKTLSMRTLSKYISLCKTLKPKITQDTENQIVEEYISLRKQAKSSKDGFVCPRTFLSIIRLASALARVRLSETVDESDIIEVFRLMKASLSSLESSKKPSRPKTELELAFESVKTIFQKRKPVFKVSEVLAAFPKVRQHMVRHCLQEYANLDLISMDSQSTSFKIIDENVNAAKRFRFSFET